MASLGAGIFLLCRDRMGGVGEAVNRVKGERELLDPSSAEEYACLTILNWIETLCYGTLPVLFLYWQATN
jgi:hypothetical protein